MSSVLEATPPSFSADDVARIAAWEWHLPSGQMRWSTDPETLFGFPAGSFGPALRIVRSIHSADKMKIEMATANALSTGIYEAQYRAVRPDWSIVWIRELRTPRSWR